MVLAFNKVRDETREKAAREYCAARGYDALKTVMWDYTSIHDVGDSGKTCVELAYPDVIFTTRVFYEGILKALEQAVAARLPQAVKDTIKARRSR